MNSVIEQSARTAPRPITTRWSAVSAISDIRWLETKTVRPSAASCRARVRTQRMPSGSSPLTGSSRTLTGDLLQADEVEHLVDPPRRDGVAGRQPPEVVAGGPAGVQGTGLEEGAD